MYGRERTPPEPTPGKGTAAPAATRVPGKQTLVGTMSAPLPRPLQSRLERSLGTDLSSVRVGEDPAVAAMGARAVAAGTEIRFAPGAYDPESEAGQQLIAHEVVHLTQQAEQPVAATTAVGDIAVNADPGLERDADQVAARALRGETGTDGAGPLRAAGDGAPVQGFFDVLGAIGDLASAAIDTTGKAVKSIATKVREVITGAPPDRTILDEPSEASRELQRILETGSLDAVQAAQDGLAYAHAHRKPGIAIDHVTFETDEGEYDLDVTNAVTDAMIEAMRERAEKLELAPDAEDSVWDPLWGEFALEFNTEFKGLLHVFGLDDDRDDSKKSDIAMARLAFLFTENQRDKLMSYFATQMIPDRLFDGDEVGRATAQQRILIAGKILADGKYRPGSYTQEVHARFCYHWARIVWSYAGVTTETSNTEVMGSFDFDGNVLLGDGRLDSVFTGEKRDPSLTPTALHRSKNPDAYRGEVAPWSLVMDLQPGDWLYVYVQNATINGEHSVIFGGWLHGMKVDERTGLKYREAWTYDQASKASGGDYHTRFLAEELFSVGGEATNPVTQIRRVGADVAPADEVNDLILDNQLKLFGPKNTKFIKKKAREYPGRVYDGEAFRAWLRPVNLKLLEKVADKLQPGQTQLLLDANNSVEDGHVIALNQRLRGLVHNEKILDDNMKTTYENDGGLDDKQEAAMAVFDAKRIELVTQWFLVTAELAPIEAALDPLRNRLEALDLDDERRDLETARRVHRKEAKALTGQAHKDKVQEILALNAKLAELRTTSKQLAKDHAPELKALHAEIKPLEKAEARLLRRIASLHKEVEELFPDYKGGLVHPGPLHTEVKVTIDGRFVHLGEEVKDWGKFFVAPER